MKPVREELKKRGKDFSAYSQTKYLKENYPKLYKYFLDNMAHQKAHIKGFINHKQKCAKMESLFVIDIFRGEGYAKKLISLFIDIVDTYGYPIYGSVVPFEWAIRNLWITEQTKHNLSTEEYRQRQKRLLSFYNKFGFEVIYKEKKQDGTHITHIKREGLEYRGNKNGCYRSYEFG